MSERNLIQWTCDICNRKAQTEKTTIKDWVKFNQDNPYLDRSWYTRTICNRCINDIQKAIGRANKK